ncbi:hypothetical protein BJ508DRAFT_203906, partial [Ascobolus immersus RN42]
KRQKTYNTEGSCVVTHRSTNSAIRSLTMGERTGSRIPFNLWPYVKGLALMFSYLADGSPYLGWISFAKLKHTYSTRYSRMVTHCSTDLAVCSLTMGEQTGSRVLSNL